MRKTKLLFILLFSFLLANAQQKEVAGRVVDESGKPVPNASITIKGRNTGTTTDENGSFNLTVDAANTHLLISFVGLAPKEVLATEASLIILSPGRTAIDPS